MANQRYRVVLRRANGRLVKESIRPSKYSAKQLVKAWEEKYDEAYYVELIFPVDNPTIEEYR